MTTNIKIGLLPLYLELYDSCVPERREYLETFANTIADELRNRGLEVCRGDVCRIKDEFSRTIQSFEKEDVCAIVTLHLAYSPSLESIQALSQTRLPIIVLDTTPDFVFGPRQDSDKIMNNHGIHGVQDMCNMLIRNRKDFFIEAGHWKESDVLDRIASRVRAASMALNFTNSRVGIAGTPFKGMGDFAIPFESLKSLFGMNIIQCPDTLPAPNPAAIDAEIETDLAEFATGESYCKETHRRSVSAGLKLRTWIQSENLSAFTMNFLDINKDSGMKTVPFLEASKAMSRCTGYAGEGDVLTAALTGTLLSVYPETTFTEMFCPDWKGNRIFMSHMGELNPVVSANKPVLEEKPFPFTDADNPIFAVSRLKAGNAVLVNLAPGPDDSFRLISAPLQVADVQQDNMGTAQAGWLKPPMDVKDFLAEYSCLGGTHHSVLVYAEAAHEITSFGQLMGWETYILQ